MAVGTQGDSSAVVPSGLLGACSDKEVPESCGSHCNNPNFWSSMAVVDFDTGCKIPLKLHGSCKGLLDGEEFWAQITGLLKEDIREEPCVSEPSPVTPQADRTRASRKSSERRRLMLPFPADFSLKVADSRIHSCHELCQPHSAPVSGIAFFMPGCVGGVGPARQPGMDFDSEALFPLVAKNLVGALRAPVDCYRLSWEDPVENVERLVKQVRAVVKHAITKACRFVAKDAHHVFKVFFVGHSLGGEVALEAALDMANRLAKDPLLLGRVGQRQALVVSGICTLNTSPPRRILSTETEQALASLEPLSDVPLLTIAGDADHTVCPDSSLLVHMAFPSKEKEMLTIPGGTHDLYMQKAALVQKVSSFIASGL